ncbi:hypothetical protein [Streptomyces sp. NPDC001675]
MREQFTASLAGLDSRVAAARRGRWENEKDEMRRHGRLLDSIDALVTAGLCQVLEERGWNHEWDDIPHQAKAPGRSRGSPDSGWPDQVNVRLPVDLVNTVLAACWHTSKEPREQLQKWHKRHPKARPTKPTRARCDPGALAEYQELRRKINYTGDVWRDAVASGIIIARTARDSAAGGR